MYVLHVQPRSQTPLPGFYNTQCDKKKLGSGVWERSYYILHVHVLTCFCVTSWKSFKTCGNSSGARTVPLGLPFGVISKLVFFLAGTYHSGILEFMTGSDDFLEPAARPPAPAETLLCLLPSATADCSLGSSGGSALIIISRTFSVWSGSKISE